VLTPELQVRLKERVDEKQDAYGYRVLGMEVMPGHVHLLLDVDPRKGIHQVVGRIKGYTAHLLRSKFPWLKSRLPSLWTRSKFLSTVGSMRRCATSGEISNTNSLEP
jgi:putative transposase